MDLSESQQNAVTQWVAQGLSLADIQRQLLAEFEISMTYMDVRFMVDDLNIIFEEPAPEVQAAGESAADLPVEDPELLDEDATGGVVLDVDVIMLPGALVSGTVTFSDGIALQWQLSAAGQLGLIPGENPEYRPSPEDVESFQVQLEEVLRSKGY
ncbi:MAG: hypothetical protein ACI81V_000457 [Lentimonas sp.]|jgi:hypothetical protein